MRYLHFSCHRYCAVSHRNNIRFTSRRERVLHFYYTGRDFVASMLNNDDKRRVHILWNFQGRRIYTRHNNEQMNWRYAYCEKKMTHIHLRHILFKFESTRFTFYVKKNRLVILRQDCTRCWARKLRSPLTF